MKAAVLRQVNKPMEIEDIIVSKPGPREVLVRAAATGVCHSDLHFYNGTYQRELPMVLGHECAGIVEQVGADVRYVKPGDHVITCLSVFCGHCEHCLTGHLSLCESDEVRRDPDETPRLSSGGVAVGAFAQLGSFAEQMLVHEHAVVKIDRDMPLDRAALIGCAVTTGIGAVIHTAKVAAGETVAVIGCGGIGLSSINGAYLAGASRIIAIDRVPAKLELAKRFGATDTINAADVDAVAAVLERTSGGVHHAFEAIGLKVTAEQSFQMIKRGGAATVIGMIPPTETVNLPGWQFIGEKRIEGSFMGSDRVRIDMPRFVSLYMQGRLHLDELISGHIQLKDVNEALLALETGEVARNVIMFDAGV